MRLHEVSTNLDTFLATVDIVCGSTTMVVKTGVDAESQTYARAILCHIYVASKVMFVLRQAVNEDGVKTQCRNEQRVKALSDRKDLNDWGTPIDATSSR
jgi:hypothetical protein